MIKAIRADKEYRTAPKGREIINFQERWGYVPSRNKRDESSQGDRQSVDYRNLQEELEGMNISIDNI